MPGAPAFAAFRVVVGVGAGYPPAELLGAPLLGAAALVLVGFVLVLANRPRPA